MAVVETESTGNAVLPDSPPAPSSVEDKDPAPHRSPRCSPTHPRVSRSQWSCRTTSLPQMMTMTSEEEDEDMDEEEINQSALSAALHPQVIAGEKSATLLRP